MSMSYEYEWHNTHADEEDEWHSLTLNDDFTPKQANSVWLKEFLEGKHPQYRVRYRAVLRSAWEPYTEEVS